MNEDIISLFYLHPSYTTNISEQITPTLFAPVANASFTNNEKLDWTILHRRFDHTTDEKMAQMCTQ